MEVLVSTLALMGKTAEEIIAMAQKNGWTLEFSSGMPYRPDMEKIFLEAPVERYAHNYFPAPEKPFVLNLASVNKEIRETSIQHCIKGLELSKKAGAPFFSAHAGFCVDPAPDELGRKLNLEKSFDRNENWKHFIDSVKTISESGYKMGMRFLIENNVLAPVNVHPNGSNPLFCCDPDEMIKMLNEVNAFNVDMLIDTGHLKVSAQTLKFDMHRALEKLMDKVGCIHHSDNDGTFDTNDSMGYDYWFLPYVNKFANIVHVIEVKKLSEEEIIKQLNILSRWRVLSKDI